jgi:methylthioribose-1-phosphate isomerase
MAAHNPAFDVTPARLVSGIITEVGVARPPFARSLPSHVRRAGTAGGAVASA